MTCVLDCSGDHLGVSVPGGTARRIGEHAQQREVLLGNPIGATADALRPRVRDCLVGGVSRRDLCLCAQLEHEQLGLSLGLVSTVLGAAKDALAREYVSLASHERMPALDLRALFTGDAGG